jgi:hypothetical protein
MNQQSDEKNKTSRSRDKLDQESSCNKQKQHNK